VGFSAQGNNLWFTGYNYDGKALENESISTLKQQVFTAHGNSKIFACINLANKAYLLNKYPLLFTTLNYALAYGKSSNSRVSDSLLYYLYNLKCERLMYAGQYVEAYEVIKEALTVVPQYHLAHAFLRHNRIKLLAKSIAPVNILGIENHLIDLADIFLAAKAYTPYIEILLMQQQNFPQHYSIKGLEEKFTLLDESHRAEGFMNLYYYTGSVKPGYLFNALAIPPYNYLAYFRLNMGLVEHYNRSDSIEAANHHLKLAHRVLYYLADYEVNRHFVEYHRILKEKTKVEPTLHAFINPVDYDYREQFLASKSAAADLLKEAKEAITKERNRNHLFINWLAALLMLVILLLAFVFYGFKKLKQSTTYNNWITTALSHDLRSPIAHISNALNKPNGINQAKSNLINYEYLLDDTLSMAMHVQGNKTAAFKAVDLVELMDELLLDLQFIMLDKEIVIKNELPDDLTIKGDYAGLKVLFRNIFLNAIKHNKQKGFINIKAIVGPTLSVLIENSIGAQTQISTPSAGSQLIHFFSKQNKARYRFKKQNDVAVSEVKFLAPFSYRS